MTTHQEFDSSSAETLPPLYRVQNHTEVTPKVPFVERPFLDFSLLILYLFSAWLLAAAFMPAIDVANLATGLGNGAIVIGLPGLCLSLVAGLWRLRWRINHYRPWWNDACPACQGTALKRKQRRKVDRIIGRLGIPVRRYICADCRWQGRLIDERRVF